MSDWGTLLKGVEKDDEVALRSLRRQNKQYRSELLYEPLTGLYNLRSSTGKRELNARLDLVARSGKPPEVTFMSMDIDGLHLANRLYGNTNSDVLLRIFGEVLKGCSRESDYPFREGASGDEFGIVFFDFDFAETPLKIEEINDKFTTCLEGLDNDPRFSSAQKLPKEVVSFSAGITKVPVNLVVVDKGDREVSYHEYENVFDPGGAKERTARMYNTAKAAGKNRYVMEGVEEPIIIRKDFAPLERTIFDNLPEKKEKEEGGGISGMLNSVRGLFRR